MTEIILSRGTAKHNGSAGPARKGGSKDASF